MSCIYLLYNDEGYGYIGKTTNIKERLKYHKRKSNDCSSTQLGGNFKHLILEEVAKEDLCDYEQYYYDMYNDMFKGMLVNTQRPLNTIKHYAKEYYKQHTDTIKEYRQQHAEKIKEERKKYNALRINREKNTEKERLRYEKNKEQIKLRRNKRNAEKKAVV